MDAILTLGDIKTRLIEKYLPTMSRSRFLEKLYTFRQDSMSVQEYRT